MGVDLTQDQIGRLFAGQDTLTEKLDTLQNGQDEMRPQLAVVESQTNDLKSQTIALQAELHNGLSGRLRRTELMALGTLLVISLDKGPSIAGQLIKFISVLIVK